MIIPAKHDKALWIGGAPTNKTGFPLFNSGDEQMFGANQQVPHACGRYKETETAPRRNSSGTGQVGEPRCGVSAAGLSPPFGGASRAEAEHELAQSRPVFFPLPACRFCDVTGYHLRMHPLAGVPSVATVTEQAEKPLPTLSHTRRGSAARTALTTSRSDSASPSNSPKVRSRPPTSPRNCVPDLTSLEWGQADGAPGTGGSFRVTGLRLAAQRAPEH